VADVYLRKTLTGFVPADEAGREVHLRYKLNEVYRADIVKPRSYQSHKLCMSLIDLTYSNLPETCLRTWPNPRAFRRMLADAVGHVESFRTQEGETKTIALSLSYDDIPDEVTFQRIYKLMLDVCAHLLAINNRVELQEEVEQYAANGGARP
jgi:hypothetical protein